MGAAIVPIIVAINANNSSLSGRYPPPPSPEPPPGWVILLGVAVGLGLLGLSFWIAS